MRNGDVVVFSFRPLLGKIGSESVIPDADVLGSIEKSIAKITGTTLLHMGVGIVQLAGLVGRGRKSGIGQELIRRIEAGEVTDFGQDHSAHIDYSVDTLCLTDTKKPLAQQCVKGFVNPYAISCAVMNYEFRSKYCTPFMV